MKSFLAGLKSLVKGKGASPSWAYQERRTTVRLLCQFDVDGKTGSSKKFQGQIVDMGLKGMKLRTFEQLAAGDSVFITYPVPILTVPKDTLRCRVLWTRSRSRDFVVFAGLAYDESEAEMSKSWVKYLLKQLGFSRENIYQKRTYSRAECFVPARMVYGPNPGVDGTLYNLGVGGALIEAAAAVQTGTSVDLLIGPYEDLPQFALKGRLVNRREEARRHLHGVEFSDLSPKQLRHVEKYLFHLLRQQWTE